MNFPKVLEQLDILLKNTSEVISIKELEKKLENSFKTKTPLEIKLGADPSSKDLHLGHSIVLNKLKEFQDLGHICNFIIGDFTAMIGDPSGKNKTRPQITKKEIDENVQTYFEQVSKILNPSKLNVRYNSQWLSKISFEDIIKISSNFTVAQILEREDFKSRYTKFTPISLHEFLYPLAQAFDSVFIKSDIEIGGIDQKFNLILARELQKSYNIPSQVCLMMPILVGTDGVKKMSKSLNNSIGINDTSENIFGKILSIPDETISEYYMLLLNKSLKDFDNPMQLKRNLAKEIISKLYNEKESIKAEEYFNKVVVNKDIPEEIFEIFIKDNKTSLVDVLYDTESFKSKNEIKRLIKENALSVNGEKILDINFNITNIQFPLLIKAGKRKFFKILKSH